MSYQILHSYIPPIFAVCSCSSYMPLVPIHKIESSWSSCVVRLSFHIMFSPGSLATTTTKNRVALKWQQRWHALSKEHKEWQEGASWERGKEPWSYSFLGCFSIWKKKSGWKIWRRGVAWWDLYFQKISVTLLIEIILKPLNIHHPLTVTLIPKYVSRFLSPSAS